MEKKKRRENLQTAEKKAEFFFLRELLGYGWPVACAESSPVPTLFYILLLLLCSVLITSTSHCLFFF